MLRIDSGSRGLELRGKTLCFIVFGILTSQACLYYVVRVLLSER